MEVRPGLSCIGLHDSMSAKFNAESTEVGINLLSVRRCSLADSSPEEIGEEREIEIIGRLDRRIVMLLNDGMLYKIRVLRCDVTL